ncbi:MAG: alpha/beta fold hydrolase, partial [Candidatus Binatia bacterium]
MKQKNSKKTHYRKVFFITFFFSLCSLVVDAGAQQIPSISRELHWAVTGERFELALERLRRGKRPQHQTPIILGHGLVVNSLFMNLTEEHSLARYLAHEGFDVWNLSFRGAGRSLNPLGGGSKSWTLDDMIDKDIPAVIRHVQRATGHPKVFWLGYELGGLLFYGYLAKKEDSGVAGLVAVGAPVTFTHPEQEPMKRLLRLQESPTWRKLFLSSNASFLGRLLI